MSAPVKPLSREQLIILGFIEQKWHETNRFPSPSVLENRFGEDYYSKINEPTFKMALTNRGISEPDLRGELTHEQLAAILTVVNFDDKRSRQAKLRDLGIPVIKWAGWLKDPNFKAFLHSQSASSFEGAITNAQEGLVKAVDRGDTNAIKFYMELTGRHNSASGGSDNVRLIVTKLIECIQRHVTDPAVLRAIGNDFNAILSGEPLKEKDSKVLEGSI